MRTDHEVERAHRHLARQHRELREGLEAGAVGWMLPKFLTGSALGLGITLVVPGFLGGGLGVVAPGSPAFWVKLLGPVVVSGIMTPFLYLRSRQRSRRSIDEIVKESEAELASLSSPGWVGRTVRRGLAMAAGVGLPVGALLALGSPIEEMPGGSRMLTLAGFVVVTAGWTLPFAFGVRWISLRALSRLGRPVGVDAGPPERSF